MMEVSVANNVTEASLATVVSDTALLSADTIPVVTMPLLSSDGSVNGTLGATTPTILNVNVPFLRDGAILGTAGPHGIVIATNPDGTGTVLLDTSQVALLTQSTTPAAIYDGAGILGFTTQDVNTLQAATLAESIVPDMATSEEMHNDIPTEAVAAAESAIQSSSSPMSKNEDIQPPVRKGPYKCDLCDKECLKWGQLQRHMRFHAEDKPHRCDECDASFNLESNLILHKATHCRSDPICPECGKKFSRIASLKAHVMLHEKEENLICTECGDEFTTQMQLDRHMKEHREEIVDERYYCCKQCPQKFSKASLLREHMKIHNKIRASLSHRTYKRNIDRSSFSHKCDTCGKLFQKPSQLVRHNRIHTGERPFKCKVCDKAFNQKGALQIHMTKHSGERPHRCDFCPAAFSQRGNLRAHIQRVHTLAEEGDQTLYQCEECTCVFRKLGSLNAHMSRMHSGEIQETDKEDEEGDTQDSTDTNQPENRNMKEVIFQLLELSKQAPDNEETQQQIQEIAENDKVSADILQQALENSGLAPSDNNDANQKQKDTNGKKDPSPKAIIMTVADAITGTLKRHIIRKVGGVRWHQCMYCSKEFKKPSDLVRHIRIHTHEKPYKCSQCFRAFAVKSTLTAHLRTHTGVKEFCCETCNKMFSTQGSLKVHLRLHTGAKPFSCSHCSKKFRTSGHRKSHMLSHLKEGVQRKPKRTPKSQQNKTTDVSFDDIPLQEPILITDSGLLQHPSKYNCVYNQYNDEENGVNRPYKCSYCSRAFKKSSHLKQHIRSHTGEKPFKCFECFHSFVTNGALKAHARIHSGVKAYKCNVCSNTFTTKGSLKRHMCIHSEVRPYMCPYCQKTFKTAMNCKKHMKTHRHELVIQNNSSVTVTVVPDLPPGTHVNDEVSEGATVEATGTQDLSDQIIENLTSINVDVHQREQSDAAQDPATSLASQPLTQGATLTTQAFQGQESLTQENLQQLQQSLNNQVFESQQHLTPTELEQAGLTQPALHPQTASFDQAQTNFFSHTLTQLSGTGFSQNQFTLQGDGLDVGALAGTFATSSSALITEPLVTTTMPSILQPQENHVDGTTNQEHTLLSLQGTAVVTDNLEDKLPDESQGTEDGKVGRRSFKCPYCLKTFKKSSHLKQHVRTHTGEKPYKCVQCTRMFVSMGVLRAHARTHTGVRDFKCTVCGAEFTTNGSLTRHMMIHSDARPFHCSYCTETFRTNMMYRRHLKVHRDNTVPPNVSASAEDESGGMLLNEQVRMGLKKGRMPVVLLSDEQAEELAKQNPDDTTSVSERVLIASAAEKNRISEIKDKNAEIEKLPRFANQCDHCPKSFKKPSDLVRHIRIHTGEKPFCCDTCSKSFTVKSTLDSHQKIHTGEKNFSCHVCNSLFATKGSLKVHMRLHTGAKPFKCPHCDLRFRTSGHRKSHIGTHFKETPRKRKHQEVALEQDVSSNLLASDIPSSSTQPGCLPNITIPAEALSNLAAAGVTPSQVVQGIESIQLQLSPGLLGQSIQITGLDPALLSKTVHIDGAALQQLQQQLNINITISPNLLSETLGGNGSSTTAVATSDSALLPSSLGTESASAPPGTITLNPIIIHQLGIPLSSQQQILTSENQVSASDTSIIEGDTSFVVANGNQHKESEIIAANPDSEHEEIITGDVEGHHLGTEECIARHELGLGTGNIGVDIEENTVTIGDNTISISENSELMHNIHLLNIPSAEDVSGGTLEHTYVCQICSKSFKKLNLFKEHSLTHSQQTQKTFNTHQCFHCEKVFQRKSQLDRHVRIHTVEKSFECTECNKTFSQKSALKIHLKKHSVGKSFTCPHCSMDFSQKGPLTLHIKQVHLNNTNNSLQGIILKNS